MATIKKLIQSAPRMRGVTPVPNGPLVKKDGTSLKKGGKVKKAFIGTGIFKNNPITKATTDMRGKIGSAMGLPGKPIVKNGKMIKRADGSVSQRGLWDNIRANKGSGKKPTAEMLKQEKKIKEAKNGAWQRKEGKNPEGGLNAKGRASYNRETGGHLKAPQPEGGPRKKSFCARMGGVKGPMKKPDGKPTRKALALRKWKC
jgi:hypothetical protein